jgi:hypothetical protein
VPTGKLPASSNMPGLFSELIAFPTSASCRSDFLPRRHCGTEFERSGPVRTGLGVPVFERLPPQYPDWMLNVGGSVTARPVVVRGTKLMVIWTAVSSGIRVLFCWCAQSPWDRHSLGGRCSLGRDKCARRIEGLDPTQGCQRCSSTCSGRSSTCCLPCRSGRLGAWAEAQETPDNTGNARRFDGWRHMSLRTRG